MRCNPIPLSGLALGLLFASNAASAQELAVSCAGYPRWAATTAYAVGAKVTYSGGLWRAVAASTNVPPNACPAGGWWQLLGPCSATAACTAVPSAPNGLRSPLQTASSITLNWNAVSTPLNCPVSYDVFSGSTRLASALAAPGTVLTGLAASTTYALQTSATTAAGTSRLSPPLAVTTLGGGGGCANPPSTPTGLASPSQTSSSVSLSWNPVATPSGCTVAYTVQQNGNPVLTVPTPTAIISGLAANTSYAFAVAASDAAGASLPSATLTVQTAPGGTTPTPAAVLAGIQARMTAGNQINTQPHKNTMQQSQAVNVYQVAPGVYAFSSGMAIDTDGSDSDPDPDHQGQTTWETSDGKYLGAHHVPYYVLGDVCYDGNSPCKWFFYEDRDVQALQFALVFYNGKVIGAVFGDTQGPPGGDARELGEASVMTADLLGIPSSGTTGGVDTGVTYVVFSGSQWVLTGTNSTLSDTAQALVTKALTTLAGGF